MAPRIAVIFCTRNRAARLPATLDALSRAADFAPAVPVELMLVDSASTDDTQRVLTAWSDAHPGLAKVLKCDQPGVCRAKNVGIRASTAPICVTTDDDCIVDEAFFANLAKAIPDPSNPQVVGGRIDLGDPGDLPLTIKPEAEPQQFRGKRMPTGFIMGANLAVTRAVFDKIGLFDETFGPGARFVAAEDTELLVRCMLGNVPITYDPSFRVSHFHGRRTLEEGRKLYASYSFGDGAVWAKYMFRHPFVLRAIFFSVRAIAKELVRPSKDEMMGPHKAWWRLKHQVRGFRTYLTARA